MNHELSDSTRPESLAQMMRLAQGKEPLWETTDLGAILEHQLAAPLEIDLSTSHQGAADWLAEPTAADGQPLQCFRDLFHHPRPPLALLEMTKQFAKRCRTQAEGTLPDEVATVLYFLAIAVALSRCGRRISGLDDAGLRHGFAWALEQSWLNEPTRQLFQTAQDCLGGEAAP